MNQLDQTLCIAEGFVGIKESGNNNNPFAVIYKNLFGDDWQNQPWCAVFVSVCLKLAGVDAPHSANCPTLRKLFNSDVIMPQRGDVAFFLSNGVESHVGFVLSTKPTLTTVEGNTSDGVAIRKYTDLSNIRFVRPKYNERGEEEMRYNWLDENFPDWAKPTVQKMLSEGIIKGNEHGELDLSTDMIRLLMVIDRLLVNKE